MDTIRIFSNIALVLAIIITPWWVYVTLGIGLLILNEKFFEIIIYALISDIIYGGVVEYASSTYAVFMITTYTIILYIASVFIKKHLRLYDN